MDRLRERARRRPPGYEASIGRVLVVYAGLMSVILLASLDQTIVATALPRIATDLGGLSSYSWIVTSYLLACTVTIPIYGKLGDLYGRRPLLVVAIALFLAGSVACGLAQSTGELIGARVVQGIGAGGFIPLVQAVIGNLIPPRDRGRYMGILSATVASAAIAGPAVGGWLADGPGWRWIFFLNLPICTLALTLVLRTIPRAFERRPHTLDWQGALVLAGGTAALLLGLVWGGRDYAWGSGHVLAALGAAALLLAAFGLRERRVPEPILPFPLLRDPVVAASVAAMFVMGMATLGTVTFIPLFVQGVIGTSAASSGLVLTPFLVASTCSSIVAGQLVSRVGRYRRNLLVGPLVLGTGIFLLSRMGPSASNGEAIRNMVIAGIGLGQMGPVLTVVIQNAVPLRTIAQAGALAQFGRQIGGTLGVALMALVVNQRLPHGLPGGRVVHRLPPAQRAELAHALQPAFLLAACAAFVIFLVMLLGVPERPLRRSLADEPQPAESAA